jgi:hypothetical protein
MRKLKSAFPILLKIIQAIIKEGDVSYLPANATCIIQEMINLQICFDNLARNNAVARRKPNTSFLNPVLKYTLITLSTLWTTSTMQTE